MASAPGHRNSLCLQGKALAQLQAKNYADKYRSRGEPIHLIGVEFSKDSRNIVAFEVVAA
ncbi:MAG: PD-(D/E)XK nuclease domain-containing protein [Comamonas sp.]|nr:PD-(D/E)XK nuclease domain-containing protein [Comamonas sp.]